MKAGAPGGGPASGGFAYPRLMDSHRLRGLARAGVSVWSDQLSAAMLDSGELARRIEEDAVTGVTTNPTIFAGAIVGSADYTEQLRDLKSDGAEAEEIVKALMASDIVRACDALADVHAATDGRDGYVSVEVSPALAADTEATVSEARDWVKRVNRPNLLVKVPATPEGVPAIGRLVGEGISVNATLIFSLKRYRRVMEAHAEGLKRLRRSGGDPSEVAGVASFFVSRFDTEVDRRLAEIGTEQARRLMGKTAVANARAAYGEFTRGPGSAATGGARPQRPLWASTSTKNPSYSDLIYVESLVAPGSVNTMPLETLDAYRDHGDPSPRPLSEADVEAAERDLRDLEAAGVDYDDVVGALEEEGVAKFAESWDQLLRAVESA